MYSEEEIKFNEWADVTLAEIKRQAEERITNSRRFPRMRRQIQLLEKSVEELKAKFEEEPNPGLQGEINYYNALEQALLSEMYFEAPVETLAILQGDQENAFGLNELGDMVYFHNMAEICESRLSDLNFQKIQLEDILKDNPTDTKAMTELDTIKKQMEFLRDGVNQSRGNVNPAIEKTIGKLTANMDYELLAEMHLEELAYLSREGRSIQDRQIDLSSQSENKDIPEDEANLEIADLQEQFEKIDNEIISLRRAAKMIQPLDREIDYDRQEREDVILRASGAEVFERMNAKDKYYAKTEIYKMEHKGKAPNWLRRLTLKLPTGKEMRRKIRDAIDLGKLDMRGEMDYSKEELAVRLEAREKAKIAREVREVMKEQEAKGEGTEGAKPEDKKETSSPKKEEPSKPMTAEQIEGIKAEILTIFGTMSPEAKAEYLVETFGIENKDIGKEILTLYEGLSPEARAEYVKDKEPVDKSKDEAVKS